MISINLKLLVTDIVQKYGKSWDIFYLQKKQKNGCCELKIHNNIIVNVRNQMLRQQFGRPMRRMSDSRNLSWNVHPFRRSLKQNKKSENQLKIGYNWRENEDKQQNCFLESTFKTFGYCEQESQQICFKTLNASIEKKHSINTIPEGRENIIRFSDLKKNKKQKLGQSNCRHQKQYANMIHHCQNHSKRLARFYINSLQKNNRQISHFYCIQCSANLSQMNFDVQCLNGVNITQDRYQNTLKRLINFKNKISQKQELIDKQSNIWLIQNLIKETDSKYERFMLLLQNVKKQQIMSLEMLKIQVFNQVSEQQSKIEVLKRRLEYLIFQFGKYIKCEQYRGFAMEKKWQQIYEQSMKKMKQQFDNCCRQPPISVPKIPDQLTVTQICKKVQNLFDQRVHQLSFEVQEIEQEEESKKMEQQQEKPKRNKKDELKMYLREEKEEQTFINQQNMVSGVDLVFSQTNSFNDQENIMINI